MSDKNPFPPFKRKSTIGEKYEPAMTIKADQAPFYFERLVEHCMASTGSSRQEAEVVERESLGYYAAYHGEAARRHVRRVFGAEHPILVNGAPKPQNG